MKRTVGFVAGLAALAVVAYVGTRLYAQAPGTTAPAALPAQTRVAVINLLQVIKNYNKAKFYETELEKTLEPIRTEAEKLKKGMVGWQNYLTDPKNRDIPQDKREEADRNITLYKRQLEDLEKEARMKFGKKREEQVVQLYKEVNDMVKRYAASNGIHLVLAYGEQVNATDLFAPANIARKLDGIQTGGAQPMYFADGLDISNAIVATLNASYPGGATAGMAPTNPAPGGGH